jgi:hypothetical protein
MVDPGKGRLAAILMIIMSALALGAALSGLISPRFYEGVLSAALLPGAFAQDVISVPAAVVLALMSLQFLKRQRFKSFIIMLGLCAYFFYAYGLFTISGHYNQLYPFYLLIFALAIYRLILGLSGFFPAAVAQTQLPAWLRRSLAAFFILVVVVFVPRWLAILLPAAAAKARPDAYAVSVLDLTVVMPALIITAYMLWRSIPFGNILAGVALLKSMTLIFSIALGTAVAPLYGLPLNYPMLGIYCLAVLFSLFLGTFYMLNLIRRC